jgi:hypothetical protein
MIFMARLIKNTTNFMIWNKNINKILEKNKNLIIIFGHPKCKPCQKIMFWLPIIFIKSYINWYTLRFCNVIENKEKSKDLWISITPTLLVYKNAEIYKKIKNEKEIFEFLKDFK